MTTARITRVTLSTALVTLAVGAVGAVQAVPAAAAVHDPRYGEGSVVVYPSTVRAGGEVNLRVDACDGDKGIARSKAFVASVALKAAADQTLTADASILRAIEPGSYQITIDCYDKTGNLKPAIAEGRVTVVGHRPTHKPTHQPTHHPTHHPTMKPLHPTAPVRAGGGGAATETAAADSSRVPQNALLGLAGAAAAGLAGAALLRRRRVAREAARPGGDR